MPAPISPTRIVEPGGGRRARGDRWSPPWGIWVPSVEVGLSGVLKATLASIPVEPQQPQNEVRHVGDDHQCHDQKQDERPDFANQRHGRRFGDVGDDEKEAGPRVCT